jgi:outer membrane protein assembly factor BamB
MNSMRIAVCCLAAALWWAAPPCTAAAWPQFRGPNCSGVSEIDKPPVEFGSETNLLWKTELPSGLSSACVWQDRIFLTGLDDGRLQTLCVDRNDGKVLWRQNAPAERVEEVNPTSSPASATPATDGRLVYVYFGSYGLLAYDFEGEERWRKPLPIPVLINGSGTSPVLLGDLLLLNRDQEEEKSSLLAVDPATGKTVWETARPGCGSSYTTPILWKRDAVEEVVLAGALRVVGYDLKTGGERWSAAGLEVVSVCPTPVIGDGRLYAMSRSLGGARMPSFAKSTAGMDKNDDKKIDRKEARGLLGSPPLFNLFDQNKDDFVTEEEWDASVSFMAQGEHGIFAMRAPGTGDLTGTHVVWKQKRGVAIVASPLFYRGLVYVVQDGGRLSCFRADSGEALYVQERLGADGEYYASPVAADGNIYLASTRGTISVVEAGETLKVLSQNKLGERIMATPAIAGDKLYIRTATQLWAFGR